MQDSNACISSCYWIQVFSFAMSLSEKSLCADKLGIDIYHIDMTMFCFPWYPRKGLIFVPRHPNIVVSVASHVSRQPRSTSRRRVPQRGGGIFGLPVIHGDDPILEHRASVYSLVHFTEPLIVGKALFPVISLPVCKGVSITTPAHELR